MQEKLVRRTSSYESPGLVGPGEERGRKRVCTAKPKGNDINDVLCARRTHAPRSFLKWAGSKNTMAQILRSVIPDEYGTYYEPMVGSGVLFFTLAPRRAVLGDANSELMNCYEVVRERVDELIRALRRHRNTSEHYYRVRAQLPQRLGAVTRAARTIYLSKTCFNGLYRVNSRGLFNVPFGDRRDAIFCDEETLRRTHDVLKRVRLKCGDFRRTVAGAKCSDFVYFDPPYFFPPSKLRQTARYSDKLFDAAEHERLCETFRELDARGCHVVLSNSDVPAVRSLYRGYVIRRVPIRRSIAASSERRTGWHELVICNYDVPKRLTG